MRDQQAKREKAVKRILKDYPNRRLYRGSQDVRKFLLAEECDWTCPYTDRHFGISELLGQNPQFDIEHIIPFHRSLDNSFINLTLCHHEENRNVKGRSTPHEAYGQTGERWEGILSRVAAFRSDAAKEKLRRFRLETEQVLEEFGEFIDRQLNDTRYTSRLAHEYLALLYGGRSDEHHKQQVFVTPRQLTARLRAQWGLNGLLPSLADSPIQSLPGDMPRNEKDRCDARHHAVDAAVVAMTMPGTIKAIADAAEAAAPYRHKLMNQMALPWPTFFDNLKESIGKINVSHREDRQLAGKMHLETIYSQRRPVPTAVDGKVPNILMRHTVRRPIQNLSLKGKVTEVDRIIDRPTRKIIQEALGNEGRPKRLFADPSVHPVGVNGRPIHRVRIWTDEKPWTIGIGPSARLVKSDSNHHIAVVEHRDKRVPQWKFHTVSRYEAYLRKCHGKPVVQLNWGRDAQLVLWLCKGDCIEMEEDHEKRIFVIKSFGESELVIRLLHDVRLDDQVTKAGERGKFRLQTPNKLKERNARKVTVDALGRIHPCDNNLRSC